MNEWYYEPRITTAIDFSELGTASALHEYIIHSNHEEYYTNARRWGEVKVSNKENDMKKNDDKKKGIEIKPEINIKKVIFSPPVTVVLFDDGSKSVVRVQNDDTYDPEKGLALAYMRRMLSKKDYHKWLEEAHEYVKHSAEVST